MNKSTEHITHSKEYFEARYTDAQLVAEQNDRHLAAKNDTAFEGYEDFRTLALDGIHTEQSEMIDILREEDLGAYDQLADEYSLAEAELEEAKCRLEAISDVEDARKKAFLDVAKRAIELSPYAESSATALARQKIEALENLDRKGLDERIGELTLKLLELDEIYSIAGVAWPSPQAIFDHDSAYEDDTEGMMQDDSELWQIDNIPLEPESHQSNESIMARLIEFHGRRDKASLALTAYLIDHRDTIFTPQELADYLYTDPTLFEGLSEPAKEERNRKAIHRLLNQDARVPEYLAGEGMKLQYGYRHFVDPKSGKNYQRKRRIYRVVESMPEVEVDETFEETVYKVTKNDNIVDINLIPQADSLDKAEMTDGPDVEVVEYIDQRIKTLWDLGLLPRNPEGTLTVLQLQQKYLHLPKNSRHNVSTLYDAMRSYGAKPLEKNAPALIVINSFDQTHRSKLKTAKSWNDMLELIAPQVEEFYRSLDMNEQATN